MGIENVYIARVTDGLVLVASMEHGSSSDRMELFKNQAKQLIKKVSVIMSFYACIWSTF